MGPVTAKTSDAGDRREGGASESFELRKRYGRFGDADAALLAELKPEFERHADEIVDRFYDHLRQFEPLRPLIDDAEVVARLKRAQRGYLIRLASGVYDEAYARDRLVIGKVHERIGLDPQWYLGTYGLYYDLLLPHVHRRFRKTPAKAVRASAALSKLLTLDMQLVLDAYYETRHRKELSKSEQLAAVGELAASIAHEVRNPLAGMKGALEVLRGELSVNPDNLEIVDELLAQITRLENLVRDLLTFARPRAVSRQGFDLHELLDRLLRRYKEAADEAGITVHRGYGPGTGALNADLQQMEQVFLNLIHNAIQAMESGGTLTVSTRLDNGEMTIAFEDRGSGIPPADLTRIFQPFFTTKHRGSGLGLPIVKKILEAHGGSIEVSSVLGQGTTAIVTIPIGESD